MQKLVAAGLAFLGGCATSPILSTEVKLGPDFYKKNISQPFGYSRELCFEAAIAAFKNFNYGIEEQDPKDGTFVTGRKTFKVPSTQNLSGKSNETGYSGKGDSLSITTPHVKATDFLAKQSDQYYMKVSGDSSSCRIEATRWRAWNGNSEILEMQQPSENWAQDNLFIPYFIEVQDQLKSIAMKRNEAAQNNSGLVIEPVKTQRQN